MPNTGIRERMAFVAPSNVEMLSLFALLLYMVLAIPLGGTEELEILVILAPCWLGATLAYGATKMVMMDSRAIWSPALFFRATVFTFFALGSLTPLFMNEDSRSYIESFYWLHNNDLAKVNLVTVIGTIVALGTVYLIETCRPEPAQRNLRDASENGTGIRKALGVGIFYLASGAAAQYLLFVPISMGWIDMTLPGFLGSLTAMSSVGIFLITIWSLNRSRSALVAISLFVLFEAGIGMLLFSKQSTLLPFIPYAMAILNHRATRTRILAIVLMMWFIFTQIMPIVTHARSVHSQTYSERGQDFSSRYSAITSYFYGDEANNRRNVLQDQLIRITYVSTAAFAIHLYDTGEPGDTLEFILTSFIPRLIWPDKPIFMGGWELATRATGTVGNTIGTGIFAEAYWNLGWFGMLFLVPVGVYLNLMSYYSASVLSRADWLYTPIMFMGIKVAFVDGWLYGIAGTIWIMIGIHIMFSVAARIMTFLGLGYLVGR